MFGQTGSPVAFLFRASIYKNKPGFILIFFKKKLYIFTAFIIILFITLTVIPLIFNYRDRVYNSIENVPDVEIVCLLGAKVYPKGKLSPVIKQRCDALIKLLKYKRINYIYVSGSWKYEVNNIVSYLIHNNIDENLIIKDYLGYDTHDTIRHIKKSGFKKILLVSQSFHLYRAIDMCINDGLTPFGLAAEKISPLHEDIPWIEKYSIRLERYYRNACLFLIFKLKIYDLLSREAEKKEGIRFKIINP